MFNTLVVDDNFEYAKNLINYLVKNNDNIRISSIASNGEEALDHLYNSEVDIVILDLDIPFYNGLDILNRLEKDKKIKYEQSVIAISEDADMLTEIKNNSCVYSAVNKINGLDKILYEINNLINEKSNKTSLLEKKILKELKYLNYNDKFIGTKYLLEVITLIANNPSLYSMNLKKDIYPIIAEKHKKSVHNIKCNINNATVLMNCDCKKEIIMEYFHFSDPSSEAKPKQVIDTILNKLIRIEDIV